MFHPGHPFFIQINALFYRFLTFHWLSKNGEKSSDSNFTLSELLIRNIPKEGANKQVISSQADSLIKISRIWADFFPANTSNQPI